MFWPGRKWCCAEAPQKKYWRLQISYWLRFHCQVGPSRCRRPRVRSQASCTYNPIMPYRLQRGDKSYSSTWKHTSYSYTFIRSSPAKVYMLTTYIIFNVYIYTQDIHLYTCTYVYTYIYTHTYVYIIIHIYMYMYICIHIYTFVYAYECIHIENNVFIYYIYTYIYTESINLFIFLSFYLSVHLSTYLSIYVI